MKSVQEITENIRKFCDERGWSHSSPTGLLTATFSELGELAEHYQWQKEFKEFTEEEKKEISYEFVDVLWYLFRLADKSGIDIEKAFDEKFPKLAKKFPVGCDPKKQHEEYRKNGKNRLYE
ncbi:nucleotide pyrophosphohydrolase [Candidatus Dojkabacteria bacterium HGW-Dojkabacteria-1]|uniref:Nucleotide pyrophosphohydrolase n=1 Tax=Candidatus Dojkabacteria bacterium HGW-Dojkabacteria-1 TaxID=2013761 RepID=A0A2N2F3Y9_9BACT|nr:MAG: nucleotide pyrophosphohydrolase [Candidatus Dojkabacteria bacterium HGW-Dojkabacteria-1]